MAKTDAGEPLAQTLHLNAHELLVWTNRETSRSAASIRSPNWFAVVCQVATHAKV